MIIPATGVIEFNPGDTSVPITVQVTGDFNIEPDEAFTVHLNTPVNATISDADGTGTIVNDDFTPTVHVCRRRLDATNHRHRS